MLRANSDAIRYGMVRMGKLRGSGQGLGMGPITVDGAEHR